jgi:hypothetical protein
MMKVHFKVLILLVSSPVTIPDPTVNTWNTGITCTPCLGCPAGKERVGCSGTSSGSCVGCSVGSMTLSKSSGEFDTCHWSCPCPAGYRYIFVDNMLNVEEGCMLCPAGTYSTGINRESTCTTCPSGNLNVRVNCGVSSEGSCVACTAVASCQTNQYRSVCSGITVTCTACTCNAGGFWSSICEGISAGSCSPCPIGTVSTSAGLTSCTQCSTISCPPSNRVIPQYRIGCGGSSQGTCTGCNYCNICELSNRKHWNNYSWTGTSAGTCLEALDCRSCTGGEYNQGCVHAVGTTPGNPGSCVSCPPCLTGQYRHACGLLSSGCMNCSSVCGPNQYSPGCGGNTTGTCQSCPNCTVGTFRSGCSGT